jgi:hypothetical protein
LTGGTSYKWYSVATGGTAEFTSGATYTTSDTLPVGTHTYYVAAVGAGTCESTDRTEVSITVNSMPTIPTVNPTDTAICPGTSITLIAIGESGAIFKWYDSQVGGTLLYTGQNYVVNPTVQTNYYVSQSLNLCESARQSATVRMSIILTAPAVSPSDTTLCYGEAETIILSGGTTYNWYTSASGSTIAFTTGATYNIPTDLPQGIYTYYVTSVNGCESIDRTEVTIRINTIINAPAVTPTTATMCYTSTETFSLSGGITYNWYTVPSGGTAAFTSGATYTTPNDLSVGTHTYYVSAVAGCESETRRIVNIKINHIPETPAVSPSDTIICPGSSAILQASGESGAVFNWYDNPTGGTLLYTGANYSVSPSALTKYYVSQTVNSCESAERDSAAVNPILEFIIKTIHASYCAGDAGCEYLGITYTEGIYSNIRIPGTTACDTSVTLIVEKNPVYNIPLADTICFGNSYSENGFNVNPTTTGLTTYQLDLTTIRGCDSIVVLDLYVKEKCTNQIIQVENDYFEFTYGDTDSRTFTVSTSSGLPLTLEISGTSANVSTIAPGTYSISVNEVGFTYITVKQEGNDTYDSAEAVVTVLVKPAKLILKVDDKTISIGDAFPLYTYTCSGFVYGEGMSVVTVQPILYCSATTTDIIGEFAITGSGAVSTNYEIEYINGKLIIEGPKGALVNAFTPYHQDGLNDVFGYGYDLMIFNRWGTCLYRGKEGWDGQYKGNFVSPGVYYYIAKDWNGTEFRGSVMLVKPL